MEKPYSPGLQLLILLGLTLFLGVFSQVIFGFILVSIYPEGIEESILNQPWVFLSASAISQVFTHLLAFILFLRITGQSFSDLILNEKLRWNRLIWIPIVLVLSLYGVELVGKLSSSLFEYLNYTTILEDELIWQNTIAEMFTHNNPARFLFSLFAVAVLPAIGEELIYRGILFKKLLEATGNVHFAVIISGVIFAAMHSQPVQILPIACMGIVFGYIYYYTKSIWYSIILHFLINGIQITLFYFWPEIMA